MIDIDQKIFAETRHLCTPFLLLDLEQVRRNVESIRSAFPGVEVCYALKCNPHPKIVRQLSDLHVGFEVASVGEVTQLLASGISGNSMMCLNPIKTPALLRMLCEANISVLAIDSRDEIEKIAYCAPGSRVLVRVKVPEHGSRVHLNNKFAVLPDEAVELLHFARNKGLHPVGITMHVGSQCEMLATWSEAFEICKSICSQMASSNIVPEIFSMGGGLPVQYSTEVPPLSGVGLTFENSSLRRHLSDSCRITIEPGRAIAASAGNLIASVIGTATRNGIRWVYLDAGIYHGLFETLPIAGEFRMPIVVENPKRTRHICRLAGPTCDGIDVLSGSFDLPELRVGDRIAFQYAGAYSTSLSTTFNGFAPPTTYQYPELAVTPN